MALPAGAELPDGYWPVERTQPILDSRLEVTLAPDLGHLSPSERQALDDLLAAGAIMHTLYEQQLHEEALDAKRRLQELHAATADPAATRNLLDLFYLFKGPVATTLDNERLPFLPVGSPHPGKTVYPSGLARQEIDAFLAAHPADRAALLAERTVVRRATADALAADLAMLDGHPGVAALHPGLRARLEAVEEDPAALYAVPYALAYAPQLAAARRHLERAADAIEDETPDFAAYLRNRGRDLLSGDYESGDAAWVTGGFGNLNLQFGSYETYDDALMGVKAFYSASLLARDAASSEALAAAMTELQSIEDALPYEHQKRVRSHIPVGVYNVVADFGQARGANTATILPNDPDHARKYGRIVLIRNNILGNPAIFDSVRQQFDAVVVPEQREHLAIDGSFNRTLWHEIGHYLGVSVTADGRTLGTALAEYADLVEEMKSDLVSLHAAPTLLEIGYYDETGLRAHYADGIRRTLQVVKPRPEQPYQNMQLMQFNYFMEHGLIEPRGEAALLAINYDRYHDVVSALLGEVLHLQYAGDYEATKAFVQRWNYWDDRVHGRLAQLMRDQVSHRGTLVRYAILEN
ncbi:MAG TPA: hypothetical protein VLS87_06715 [Woeseiaceae bacterium]|nr:hypothetical protein [Woeseiaceae bacterium]